MKRRRPHPRPGTEVRRMTARIRVASLQAVPALLDRVRISELTGLGDGSARQELTLGLSDPGANVQLRIRSTSDLLCPGTVPACGRLHPGTRVDRVAAG